MIGVSVVDLSDLPVVNLARRKRRGGNIIGIAERLAAFERAARPCLDICVTGAEIDIVRSGEGSRQPVEGGCRRDAYGLISRIGSYASKSPASILICATESALL